jgi:hypothetical protein
MKTHTSLLNVLARLCITVTVVASVAVAGPDAASDPGDGGPLFYGVHPFDNSAEYPQRGFQPVGASGEFAAGGHQITMAGETVESGVAIAVHPLDGTVFVVLKLDDTSSRMLATLDPATGLATEIGTVTLNSAVLPIAGLAFNSDGSVLYGVSGDGGGGNEGPIPCKSCLVEVNPNTGLATNALPLGTEVKTGAPDAFGEAIVFDPDNDLLYHVSGFGDDRVFESLDPANNFDDTDIPITGAEQAEAIQGLGYDPATLTFYATDWNGGMYTITAAGVSTFVAFMDGALKGLAIVSKDDPVAVDDHGSFAVNQGSTFIDVLENDIDGSVTPVGVVQTVTQPPNGESVVQAGGIGVRYEPDPGECHTEGPLNVDSFTYTLDTGSTATVRISIPCPTINSTLTLRYVKTRRTFKGTLSTPSLPACASGVDIFIFKESSSEITFVDSTVTGPDGTFKLRKKARGRYFADSAFHEIPQTARCSGATSPTIRVRA